MAPMMHTMKSIRQQSRISAQKLTKMETKRKAMFEKRYQELKDKIKQKAEASNSDQKQKESEKKAAAQMAKTES